MAGKAFRAVKVRIRRGGLGENLMVYPARYDAHEVDRSGFGPLNAQRAAGAYSGHIGFGGDEEWCIIVLSTALAKEYARDPDMEIVTAAQADALMEEWRVFRGEPEEAVLDTNRVNAIQTKQAAGIALSGEDRRALDPSDAIPGINKRLRPIRGCVERIGGVIA